MPTFKQTSGSRDTPPRLTSTPESWRGMREAKVRKADRRGVVYSPWPPAELFSSFQTTREKTCSADEKCHIARPWPNFIRHRFGALRGFPRVQRSLGEVPLEQRTTKTPRPAAGPPSRTLATTRYLRPRPPRRDAGRRQGRISPDLADLGL